MRAWPAKVGALVGWALVTLALTGCPSPPPEAPEPCDRQVVTLNLYASDDINPSEQKRPRPVVVKLYQLVNDIRMVNASYDDILLRDAEVLQDDLMQVNEVEVFPNDLVEVRFERIPEAAVLCGAAMFRDPKGQSWKTFYQFPPMPNSGACGELEADAGEPEAAPRTAFFVVETKIDNGTQYDESMFPNATAMRRINLPKRSATSDQYHPTGGTPPVPAQK
jgi:type VI secretion system protein VasD